MLVWRQEVAKRIAHVSVEAKLKDFDEEAYVESFRPHLMDVVHTWCKGATFGQICQMTDVFEGITGFSHWAVYTVEGFGWSYCREVQVLAEGNISGFVQILESRGI